MPSVGTQTRRRAKAPGAATKRYVQRAISRGIETKYQTGYHDNEITSSLEQFLSLISISQGDSEDDRTGNEVSPTYFKFRGTVYPNSTASPQVVRLVLFQWKPNRNDFTPASSDILQNTTNQPVYSPLNYNNPQFRLLADRILQVPGASETNRRGTRVNFNIPRKKLMKMKWKSTTSSEDSGHLYLMVLGTQTTGTNSCNIEAHHVLSYKDA